MNVLTIIIGTIFLVLMLLGYKRGFINSVLRTLLTAFSLVIAYFVAPAISGIICDNTKLDDRINDKIYSEIREIVGDEIKDQIDPITGDKYDEAKEVLIDIAMQVEPSKKMQDEFIDSMDVPEFVKKALKENNDKRTKTNLGSGTFYDYLADYVTKMIMNAAGFFIAFAILWILSWVIFIIGVMAMHIPVVGGINRLGGLALGLVEAVLLVWVFFMLVAVAIKNDIGINIYKQIEESSILKLLYDKNIFMSLVMKS